MSYRATPQNSPFIPPLPTLAEGATGSPHHPPVIPSPSGGGPPYPSWAHSAQHTGNYPIYPSSPYTSTPFIPTVSPAMSSGAYIPPPPGGYNPPPAGGRGGLSVDYTGYPQFGPSNTPYPAQPQNLHPPTPWQGPASAPLQGMTQPPWNAPHQPYPPFQQPQFPQQHFQQPQTAGPFPNWGGFTPGYPMGGQGPDPWGLPAPAGPPQPPQWAQAQMMMQMQMQPPGQHQQPQQQPVGPLGRASAHEGDRVNPFMAGEHYGPVLEPFLVRIVGAQLRINPLIQPVPEAGDRPHLIWNMLFPSSNCQRSTDPSHISWVEGRHEPATFPRVSSLRIVSDTFPWMITVNARKPGIGVTCGDLIDRLSSSLHTLSSGGDYDALPPQKKGFVREAYHHNRSRAHGVPGGILEAGMRRLDFLGKDSMFGGIENDEGHVRRICGSVLPCTLVLKCQRRLAMTADEIRDQEARQRAAAESRRATVSTDDSEDD